MADDSPTPRTTENVNSGNNKASEDAEDIAKLLANSRLFHKTNPIGM